MEGAAADVPEKEIKLKLPPETTQSPPPPARHPKYPSCAAELKETSGT
jgi:hypothetical protein